MLKFCKRHCRNASSEDGGVTVEFVLIFPVLLILTGVTMDVAFMNYKKSQIHEAIQDVMRSRSIGRIPDENSARVLLEQRLAQGFTDEPHASVLRVDGNMVPQPDGKILSTSVRVPLHDMQLLGFFADLVGDPDVFIGDQMFIESYEIATYDPNGGWTPEDTTMVDGILTTDPSTTTDPTSTNTYY